LIFLKKILINKLLNIINIYLLKKNIYYYYYLFNNKKNMYVIIWKLKWIGLNFSYVDKKNIINNNKE
jgi:hypothetical protein